MNNTEKYTRPAIRDERTFHNIAMVLMIILALYCLAPFSLCSRFLYPPKRLSAPADTASAKGILGRSVRLSLDKEIHDRQSLCAYDFGNGSRYSLKPPSNIPFRISPEPKRFQSTKCICLYPILLPYV